MAASQPQSFLERGRQLFGAASDTTVRFAQMTGTSYLFPALAGIVVLAIVIYIGYNLIQLRKMGPAKVMMGPLDLFNPSPTPVVVDRPTVTASMNGSYTLAFYVKIDAVPDMRVASTPLMLWPSILQLGYNAAKESLVWTFAPVRDSPAATAPVEIQVENVPLQRWVQVVLSLEGRSVDVYINGKLFRSALLTNIPPIPAASITVVPKGIMGQLAYVQVWPRRLTTTEIANNYIDTSDSVGRPFLGPEFITAIKKVSIPNLFCSGGACGDGSEVNNPSGQTWEFPYQ